MVLYACQPVYVSIAWVGVTFDAGADTRAKAGELRNVTVAAVNALGPGVTLRRPALFAAAETVEQATVPGTGLAAPVGDETAGANQCIRTRLDLVTVNGV